MKKCHRCAKPACLHITEIHGGEVTVLHFCESCAHAYLSQAESKTTDPEEETAAIKLADVTGDRNLEELDRVRCPSCGITFRQFRQAGRLGCPHDYVAFEKELLPLLENIHGDVQHRGKFPKRAPDASQRQYQLIKLRNEMRTAVEDEDYERAASLRDEIQHLEAEHPEGSETE